MEKQKLHEDSIQADWKRVHTVRLVLCFLLNVLVLIGVVAYGGFYVSGQMVRMTDRIDQLTRDNLEIKQEMELLRKQKNKDDTPSLIQTQRQRREVLSSSSSGRTLDLNSLIRGRPGPPGPPGKDGKDGRDYTSLQILNDVIAHNVKQEWKKLSDGMPVYSGLSYIRWGRKTCPSRSELIYRGQMAAPNHKSSGGGSNYQCLPDDPEYNPTAPSNLPHSSLGGVRYELWSGKTMLTADVHGHRAPCAVCETVKRGNQIMIPAKTRCPTDDWTLDYKGYLMSPKETYTNGQLFVGAHNRGMYVCVDGQAESVTGQTYDADGGDRLYPVAARCSGDGALTNCPPYLTDSRALSCVVCSK